MVDLIQAFFERELSESEADLLGKLLQESPDSALRFEGLLETHYLATGLPSPELPLSLQKFTPVAGKLGALGWGALAVAIATGVGLLAWKLWPVSEIGQPVAARSLVPVSRISAPKAIKKSILSSVHSEPTGPSAVGEELSVVVDTREKSLVTVRVLNAAGQEVRHLFTGFVEPGQRSFQWDGNLSAGEPAPPGSYRIDVQTGDSHQTKNIRLNLK
jgi:hypothetical protein